MSRMNELSIAIDELRNAAAALNSVADSLTQLFSSEEPAKQEPAPKPITKEEVRAELAAKSAAGYGVQVRALLKRYGAAQLSAVNPDDYADLLLEAQAIGTEVGADDYPRCTFSISQSSLVELPAFGQADRAHPRQWQHLCRRGQRSPRTV